MSLTVSVLQGGANSHETTAEEANAVATDFISEGVVGAITNTSGVAPMTGAFAVNAQGTPDMTVAVSSGVGYVTATPTSGNSQVLRVKNSATTNVTISANSTGGTRYDWLYIKIDPDKAKDPAADASDVATLVTSRSTSSTTDNGTPPTYSYPIAVITVANGASSITNGNITDKRSQTGLATAAFSNIIYDFVASGCVWSGDSYGSTRAASMTSGVVYISGVPLTVPSVTARTFTASKDTYVDLSNNGDGTAAITYTEVTNNAASPALASGAVRIAIIVTGASSIANSGSVNQGQEDKVLPIASSVPYQVTDSLGNLICPRDPSRKILGRRQITSAFSTASTSWVAVTGLQVPVIIPTGRKIKAKVFSYAVGCNTSPVYVFSGIFDGSISDANRITSSAEHLDASGSQHVQNIEDTLTPTSTNKTYLVGVKAGAGTMSFAAAAHGSGAEGGPAFLQIELA